ncbi:hypothetical protein ABB37_01196 [Leptomonas pyrrhocoris]|uniref:TRAF3-interacting protein 1 N-terminal domain-containing protein n=1 Tax=Leptomonas pyrrhocoris TaxID=157538 RepID=A0A0M9G8K1_LEPPY|nr:hypothetical protein ABB37_01196 [Leptomonas pyrrhocoris]KPA84689.1 hypothetical protein ABB37_01196 [Leptomonas pyrrhocoris]|eukprot:XP_015663128.1 hypothetical protein ABB37_01196 [Leptomonas pyrrhocoris]
MSEEVDFWSATIAAYAPLQLPAPEMTPKLLMRPPFRFIHDIVCGIDGRFAAYSHVIPTELQDSANVDSKEKKIQYLTILIEYVSKLMNVQLDVSAKKIVSGHEPEKTNVFLQYLAAAVGFAQQDKAQKEAAKQTALTSASSAQADTAKLAAQSGLQLPSRDSLPRKKSSSADVVARRKSHVSALENAQAFNRKLDGFSLNLNTTESRDIREDGQHIIKMWNELSTPQVETKPTHMPIETLETAIKRQLETIKMIDALLKESDAVTDELEALVS